MGQLFLAPAASALVNELGGHASPYLALHADDPVAWQDWDQDAVAQARRDGKLLYISIGYFSCHWWQQTDSPELKAFLILTLDEMAALGLHDHLAGGFFRYTVDPGWTTPHFEKMLYDNALSAQLYLRASRVFTRPDYETVARRTLGFMMRELPAGDGALIASLSSVDNNGIEGGYYLWRAQELRRLLQPPEREAYALAWGMNGPAPFDAGYLPMRSMPVPDVAKTLQCSEAEAVALLTSASRKLLHARGKRQLPRDTKVLAAWNGLALSAFAYAARVTGEAQYRETAHTLRNYLVQRLWRESGLARAC